MEKRIGITCSCFDLFHAGHVKMLEDAKRQCDYLIVALQTDPTLDRPEKNRPVQSLVERYIQVMGCKWVDEIVPYQTEDDLIDILKMYQLDVRIIGEEYKHGKFTGRATCASRGIELYYNKRDHRFSTSDLRKRVSDANS